ncbi:MAG TPA: hypothetical protein VFZ47_10425 [Chitinophagaceae bacterium]
MSKEKTIHTCARLAGVLLLMSSVLHSTLGTSEVLMGIKTGDVRASMADTIRAIWIYSTIMLVLSGIWTLFLAGELKQLKRKAWWQGIFIGLGYTGGSIGAIVVTRVQAHLIFYGLIGLLLLLPLTLWAGSFKSEKKLRPTVASGSTATTQKL